MSSRLKSLILFWVALYILYLFLQICKKLKSTGSVSTLFPKLKSKIFEAFSSSFKIFSWLDFLFVEVQNQIKSIPEFTSPVLHPQTRNNIIIYYWIHIIIIFMQMYNWSWELVLFLTDVSVMRIWYKTVPNVS